MNGFQRFLVNFLSATLYPCKIYGKENIPEGATVIVSNHFSAIDALYMAKVYNRDISFLAKKSAFKNKLFGKILRSFGAIPIDRENPEIKSLFAAVSVLKKGHKLLIFPEGTRNKTGTTELQPLKGGSVVLAARGKYPIVPVMIEKKAKIFRKTKIIIGKPFELTEFYGKKFTDEEVDQMGNIVHAKMREQQDILFEMIKDKKKGKKNENN